MITNHLPYDPIDPPLHKLYHAMSAFTVLSQIAAEPLTTENWERICTAEYAISELLKNTFINWPTC